MDSTHGHKKRRANSDSTLYQNQHSGYITKQGEHESLKRKYKHLKAVHELQNRTVRHFMHNIMSPLSAVSGYLELLSNSLSSVPDSEKLDRYSSHISSGLNEIGFMLEQLHDIYKEDHQFSDESESPIVELNWLVNEVKEIVSGAAGLCATEVRTLPSAKPVYVEAELFQMKLLIYNLVVSADSFSSPESIIEIEVEQDDSEFALIIRNKGGKCANTHVQSLFKKGDIVLLSEDMDEGSSLLLGLKICAQIADQVNGHILMDKRDGKTPQFVLTAPFTHSDNSF
ncbi:sensor histidine kinase [Rhodohalobacter sp. SW132]|uniref:sensor histidine kinase n=1 Tax=Rhodohalobacter sp. SW132 TaxID=2293433 RepID=UPI000E282F61|nr:ATP-binding protein [Rhodohalobacter sp. SW132]REL38710.1 sensor histidine kinase [Rhodohalobacter sp. SW132]